MESALRSFGRSLAGSRIAVQGVGQVGSALVRLLVEREAVVFVADPRPDSLRNLPDGLIPIGPEEIYALECEVLAPCGPTGVLGPSTIPQLRCPVVCGAANNPLADPSVARRMWERGILYVPDYLANAGGLIHLAVALEGGDAEETRRRLRVIPENLERVLAIAKSEGTDPQSVAERLASEALR
jgi:leucine dehydrogenase